ncbi:hypothetical protein K470DRAFT_254171 [Piedraia hortae CBS 480.64]|uniref:ATP synthase subunit K, mitochondrial n=1 Tax=Piedraia hortae CBS 480.64 TaxID=1314780 RepID=A0A6A7CBN6_9PEZI|nr:hypothetical protein K470DRAFT_254171 [Piedraia hortae CBS 480.64]
MVAYYEIFGQKVGSHVLSMAVLGLLGGGITMVTGGSKAKSVAQGPPINASSKDEEKFIQDFLKEAEGEKKGEKK